MKAFQVVEVVGSSASSVQEAVRAAVESATIDGNSWFEVREIRGRVEDGKVAEFQVRVAIGAQIG
jgi:hypothetical protein